MKLGADRKRIAILGVLLVSAPIVWYISNSDDSAPPSSSQAIAVPKSAALTSAPAIRADVPSRNRRRTTSRSALGEFKPTLGAKNPEDRPDPASIDPTLRLDLLAKLQNIETGPPGRNLFQFGTAPPPPAAKIEIPKNIPNIAINRQPVNPAGPMPPTGPPPRPSAPPITFKYYGYQVSKSDGHKAAFLLDGDDILIAGENDTVKRRYKVVRIGINSIVIEDTQFKSTQTLPLQEGV